MIKLLISLHVPTGLCAAGLMLAQFITGPRWLKWRQRLKLHRITGFITVGVGMVHALIGIYLKYFLR